MNKLKSSYEMEQIRIQYSTDSVSCQQSNAYRMFFFSMSGGHMINTCPPQGIVFSEKRESRTWPPEYHVFLCWVDRRERGRGRVEDVMPNMISSWNWTWFTMGTVLVCHYYLLSHHILSLLWKCPGDRIDCWWDFNDGILMDFWGAMTTDDVIGTTWHDEYLGCLGKQMPI